MSKKQPKAKELEQKDVPAEPVEASSTAPEPKPAPQKAVASTAPAVIGVRTAEAISLGGATERFFSAEKGFAFEFLAPHFVRVTDKKGKQVLIPTANVAYLQLE